jgi:hypothetical protein
MLSERRRSVCLDVINEVLQFNVSQFFTISAGALVEHLTDYSRHVARPIDLLQIKRKLIEHKYSKYSEFSEDMELVWENAITYNGGESIAGLCAIYLRSKFRERTRFMTDDEAADWLSRLNFVSAACARLHNGIREAIANTPAPEPESEAEPEEKKVAARPRRPASKSSAKVPGGDCEVRWFG